MPDFTASPLVDALEENLFSLLEKLAAEVNTEALPLIDLSSGSPDQPTPPEVIDRCRALFIVVKTMATRRSGANHRSARRSPGSIAGSMMWNSIRTAKSPCFRGRISV